MNKQPRKQHPLAHWAINLSDWIFWCGMGVLLALDWYIALQIHFTSAIAIGGVILRPIEWIITGLIYALFIGERCLSGKQHFHQREALSLINLIFVVFYAAYMVTTKDCLRPIGLMTHRWGETWQYAIYIKIAAPMLAAALRITGLIVIMNRPIIWPNTEPDLDLIDHLTDE